MMDWVGGIETRNYGIKRRTDRGNLVGLLAIVLPVLVIGGVLLLWAWSRSQIVEMGYEAQSLDAQEKAILRVQDNLLLEEETLKSPARIDDLARNELGMVLVRSNQVVAPPIQDARVSGSTDLAMANTAFVVVEPRKIAATN